MKALSLYLTFATLCLCWLVAVGFKTTPGVVVFLTATSAAGLLTMLYIRENP